MDNILEDNFDDVESSIDIASIKEEYEREGAEAVIVNNNVSGKELAAAAAVKEGVESGNINFKGFKEEQQGSLAAGLVSITEGFIDYYSGNLKLEELHDNINKTLKTLFYCTLGFGEAYLLAKFKVASLLITLGSNIAKNIIDQKTEIISNKLMTKITSKNKITEKKI